MAYLRAGFARRSLRRRRKYPDAMRDAGEERVRARLVSPPYLGHGCCAFVARHWFRGGQVGCVSRCRRSTAGEAGLGGCGVWPLLSDAARPEFDGDVGREWRRALCSAALIDPECRCGGSSKEAATT